MKTVLAWHFVRRDRRLGYNDGRIVRKGHTLRVDPPVVLCERGLHASIKPLDALGYADADQVIACRVKLSGEIVTGDDKLVATERTCIWWVDAERTLHEFACWCAKRALKQANVTDQRCWAAIEAKLRWLNGQASDSELAAARAAARDAARDAAWAAAWAAARDAAWDAQNRKLAAMLLAAAKAGRKAA